MELDQGIVDSVLAGESRASKVDKRIVLLASFVGGPRDMRRRYLDAILCFNDLQNLIFL